MPTKADGRSEMVSFQELEERKWECEAIVAILEEGEEIKPEKEAPTLRVKLHFYLIRAENYLSITLKPTVWYDERTSSITTSTKSFFSSASTAARRNILIEADFESIRGSNRWPYMVRLVVAAAEPVNSKSGHNDKQVQFAPFISAPFSVPGYSAMPAGRKKTIITKNAVEKKKANLDTKSTTKKGTHNEGTKRKQN